MIFILLVLTLLSCKGTFEQVMEIEAVKGIFNILGCKCLIRLDEHYQCNLCNANYVL